MDGDGDASWNPAMMPHYNPDTQTSQLDGSRNPSAPTEKPQQDASNGVIAEGAFLDQFNDNDDAGATAWGLEDPSTATVPQHEDAPVSNDAPGHVESGSEPAPTGNTAKHSSTTSFARTVSHEVSFNDDEDTEWNLERTDTDPFKFMPSNERTNSFPAVPEIERVTEGQVDHPPPSSQAQDILQDLEQDDVHGDPATQPDFLATFEEDHTNDEHAINEAFQHSMGGDLHGTEAEESEARFEEGLPLIPQSESQEPKANHEPKPPAFGDAFVEDESAEGGDDFFSQIQGGPQPEAEVSFDRSLHRKSTNMVIGDAMDNVTGAGHLDSELSTPIEASAQKGLAASEAPAQQIVNGKSRPQSNGGIGSQPEEAGDLDAKWAAAFADEDDGDFLLDSAAESKELDPADIFGSDDEGFLDETIEETPAAPPSHPGAGAHTTAPPPPSSINGRYTPNNLQHPSQPPPNPYAPAAVVPPTQPPLYPQYGHQITAPPMSMGYGPPPPKPEMPKAQSFVSKPKGGYTSPYDLPMEVVKPKKRISMQQLPRANVTPLAHPGPPPRSTSMYSQPRSGGSTASLSPPSSSHSSQHPPLAAQKPSPQLKSKPSFFEDLPMTSRPRPASRHSNPLSPPQQSPQGPPMQSMPPPPQGHPQEQAAGIVPLVVPERASPYAPLQSNSLPRPSAPPVSTARYSPAPPQGLGINGVVPPPASTSRYSPAPPNIRSSSAQYTAVPPPVLAHQPRTSSPLAHFEVSNEKSLHKLPSPGHPDGVPLIRSSSSQYEPRLTRVPSLPPTKEVEEEQSPLRSPPMPSKPVVESRYSPQPPGYSPPPLNAQASNMLSPSNTLSPPKRAVSSYVPLSPGAMSSKEVSFAPPPRAQTQSPGALYGNRASGRTTDPVPRPSSVQGSPRDIPSPEITRTVVRARGMSQHLNLVPPTDGRELDPLQRWRGSPIVAWGLGGSLVTSFPTDVPRYGVGQALPMVVRSPGEVKIRHIKDIQPLEERLAKFPGPLKGKSKKKETISWLTAGIDGLEKALPNAAFQQTVSHEDKRGIERVLLWKILRILVENDGILEGNPTIDKAVRDVISPSLGGENPELASAISTGADLTGISSPVTGMQADAVDSTAIEQIRYYLLTGEREKAVWAAVDKRLWGHAILISNTLPSNELYKQVAQEFIKKEVNYPGHGNESLAALYSVLSGSYEESVDSLVPVHARAGLQLMSTSAAVGASQDALAGLDKWRETLGLILSNRSPSDAQALRSLGNLLSGYGRAEAAHICYIFARNYAVFGGFEDPNTNFVLVGADHRQQADQFAKETEALQLSEVYEYGLSLAGGSNIAQGCPHLAAYKFQHAMTLAEYGFRDKALQYCDGIHSAILAQTKRSQYYNPILESSVDDLMRRLKQAPKEESSSWIPKPRMDQVSNNMWSRFNKFVAGDDDDHSGNGPSGEAGVENGPFARLAGGTPTVSRSPSVSNFEVYGNGPSPTVSATKATSRYAPGASQPSSSPYEPSGGYTAAPRSSMERTSGEIPRSSYEAPRRGSDMQSAYGNPYAPEPNTRPASSYQKASPYTPQTPHMPSTLASAPATLAQQPSGYSIPGYEPYGAAQTSSNDTMSQPHLSPTANSKQTPAANDTNMNSNSGYQPPSYGYEPPQMNTFEPPATQPEISTGGYEPPSYQPSSFEPPSYEPGPANNEADSPTQLKPKKSFMDDDDDDIPGLRPQAKSKTDKDRENEEMFRKIAEEEAKRAAEAKANKKSWGFGAWFSGGGKKESPDQLNKPVRANLGEASSFVYDPDLKRWVNKKSGGDNTPAKTATPPPPRAASRNGTPPPPGPTSAPTAGGLTASPAGPPRAQLTPSPAIISKASQESLAVPSAAPPLMTRSVSNQSSSSAMGRPPSAPPSRPATSLSNASSIDDLLGAAGPRKGGKKQRKGGRYVDVMAK
ncbi:Sec23-binding domain of Sec16-domain-containing protein [Whalleya microplaca]|nr:Sec23-binding domain of Sec16-domain-containing protein [Whalleya microplaca]